MTWEIDPLIPDFYAGDGEIDVDKIVAAGSPWHGVACKVTEGNHYDGGSWLQAMWPKIKAAAGDRYGVDFFRLGYHYVDYSITPEQQADFALITIDRAGGFSFGDLGLAIDAERGGQRAQLSKTLVEDTNARIAEIFHSATGIPSILYGGELIRSFEITSKMNCPYLWCAEYNSKLDPKIYTEMGYTLEDVIMWQYCGKVSSVKVDDYLPNYPATTPAGLADINATIFRGGGQAAIDRLRETFCVIPA